MLDKREVDYYSRMTEAIIGNVERVIIGKHDTVRLVVLCLAARGHVLIEDVPGTGKTTLVSSLARSLDCDFSRIQFTPDVMPSDVTGFSIFNQKSEEFEFRPGGVMSNIVLADEVNRASAKTQSALLEAMEERQVTVDSITHKLEEPFMVLATQNPVEQFGTYPLPEAQVDRFLVKTSIGYPSFEQEVDVIANDMAGNVQLKPIVSKSDVIKLQKAAAQVTIDQSVISYIVSLVNATRDNPELKLGSSPRGGLALARLARAWALNEGRGYVIPDDVKALAVPVLSHRIMLTRDAVAKGRTPEAVITSIMASIAVPMRDADVMRVDAADRVSVNLGADPQPPLGNKGTDPQVSPRAERRESVEIADELVGAKKPANDAYATRSNPF